MPLIEVKVHSEHLKVIRSDIKLELIENYRGVENEPMPEKKQGNIPRGHILNPRHVFLCT
jgi:hypothetical protein